MQFIEFIQSSLSIRDGIAAAKLGTGKNDAVPGHYWEQEIRMLCQVIIAQGFAASCCMKNKSNLGRTESTTSVSRATGILQELQCQMSSWNGIFGFCVFFCGFVVNDLHMLHFLCCCLNNQFFFTYSTKANPQTSSFLCSQEYLGFFHQKHTKTKQQTLK